MRESVYHEQCPGKGNKGIGGKRRGLCGRGHLDKIYAFPQNHSGNIGERDDRKGIGPDGKSVLCHKRESADCGSRTGGRSLIGRGGIWTEFCNDAFRDRD